MEASGEVIKMMSSADGEPESFFFVLIRMLSSHKLSVSVNFVKFDEDNAYVQHVGDSVFCVALFSKKHAILSLPPHFEGDLWFQPNEWLRG